MGNKPEISGTDATVIKQQQNLLRNRLSKISWNRNKIGRDPSDNNQSTFEFGSVHIFGDEKWADNATVLETPV